MSTYLPPQTPSGEQPYGWRPPAAPRPTNPMATAGFFTALTGAVLALIPVVGIVSWLVCPVGIVLAIVGLIVAGRRHGKGRPLALTGIVLGALGLVICAIYFAVFAHNFTDGFTRAMGAPTSNPNALAPGYIRMPNFVGQSAGSANTQLRISLGDSISVMAPGGGTAVNDIVTSQSPTAGTPVNASTTFTFYTQQTGASAPPPSSAPASNPASQVGQGTLVVGSDIQAGTWRTTGATAQGERYCAWWRLKDTTGDYGTIITGGNAIGPTTMTVKSSDGAVQLQGGCVWTKVG